MDERKLRPIMEELLRGAGQVLRKHFGKVRQIRQKEDPSSVVCEADLASEAYLVKHIHRAFPEHNILSEECGHELRNSEYTWVLDPLDGTSNFVAALPWFGVMVALLRQERPIAAGMYLPIDDALYLAFEDRGLKKDGTRLGLTHETQAKNILCAFGFDPAASVRPRRAAAELLMRLTGGVRNTRATNSLVDFCYTLEGRLGACVNLKCKIWDIAPLALMIPEAGGVLTDIQGAPILFDLGSRACDRIYTILGSTKRLHPQLLRLLSPNRSK